MLEVKDLKIAFNTNLGLVKAVRGLNFSIGKGEILGIVGESGSGKTVSSLALVNLLPENAVKSGEIIFKDKNIFNMNKDEIRAVRGNDIGFIFQEPSSSFDPLYTIGKTISEAILAHDMSITKEEAREKAISLLDEVNIPEAEKRVDNFPHQFSGGQLQRIMIAASLASNPDLLIADEPTTALDVTIQSGIVQLLLKLRKERNIAIIFISHDLELVSSISDRIMVMYGGLLMEEGPSSDIIKHSFHPYTKALIDSIPRLGEHYKTSKLRTIPGSPVNPLYLKEECPFADRCWLAEKKCRSSVPQLISEPHSYRCVISGEKNGK